MPDQADNEQILCDCITMLEREGIMEYNGHVSLRLAPDRFLINTGNARRSRMTRADLCVIDLDGNRLSGTDAPPMEFHLHAGIYRNRPSVGAVVHCHPKWSTLLSMTGRPYLPVFAQGSLLYPVPVLDSPNSISSRAMSDRLNEVLGDRPGALMKSHGAVTVGSDIVEAFVFMAYLEENAERQVRAAALGTPYSFDADERAAWRDRLWSKTLFARTWNYYHAKHCLAPV